MLAGAGSFDGRVQRQKVSLLRQIINHFDDFADVVGAMAQNIDDFRGGLNSVVRAIETVGGFLHRGDAIDHFFARAIGDIEQNLRGIRNAINRSNHLIDGSGSFRNAGSLHLRVFHHVLHVDAHFMHGAGNFFNRRRRLDAHLG